MRGFCCWRRRDPGDVQEQREVRRRSMETEGAAQPQRCGDSAVGRGKTQRRLGTERGTPAFDGNRRGSQPPRHLQRHIDMAALTSISLHRAAGDTQGTTKWQTHEHASNIRSRWNWCSPRPSRWNWSRTRQHCERKKAYTNSTQPWGADKNRALKHRREAPVSIDEALPVIALDTKAEQSRGGRCWRVRRNRRSGEPQQRTVLLPSRCSCSPSGPPASHRTPAAPAL
jgi:hypothetical protein